MSEQGCRTHEPPKQCKRGEDVCLIAILQIAKTVAGRLNNLSKIDKGIVAELRIHGFGVFFFFFPPPRDKGYLLVAQSHSL